MENSSCLNLYTAAFFQRFSGGAPPEELLEFLPEKSRAPLQEALEIRPQAIDKSFFPALDLVHPTWLEEFLKKSAKPLQQVWVRLLPSSIRNKLIEHLQLDVGDKKIQTFGYKFLKEQFKAEVFPPSLTPPGLLPASSLNPLIQYTTSQVHRVIDLLGKVGFTQELSQVIQKPLLEKLHAFLTPEEKKYLKAHRKVIDPLKLPPIGLAHWNGDTVRLKSLLHKRGLKRFAYAMQEQDKDFIWYITHRLDCQRGHYILSALEDPVDKQVVTGLSALTAQVIEFLAAESSHG